MKTVILIGADPEIFVRSSENAQLISAYNLIPGTKKDPHKVPFGAVQVDGMALEFNIDPASTEEQFKHNIEHVMSSLKSMIVHDFVIEPVAHFGKEFMAQQPAEAIELGCDPDFNGWTGEENPRPNCDRDFRTAAGHVHIGWGQDMDIHSMKTLINAGAMARQMDFFLGLPSLFYDDDTVRRELYGKAGAFRPKSYGAEYRVLSNVWLRNPTLIEWVFRAAQRGADMLLNENIHLCDEHGEDIRSIIDQSRKDDAMAIINKFGLEIPSHA